MEETEPDDEEEDLEEGEERLNKKRRRLSTLKGEYVNFKQGFKRPMSIKEAF